MLKLVKDPTVIGTIAASSVGLISMLLTRDQEVSRILSNASLYGGMVMTGISKGEGVKGKLVGAAAGAAAVPLIQQGIHHLPIDQSVGNFAAGQMDDVANVVKMSAFSVGAAMKKGK